MTVGFKFFNADESVGLDSSTNFTKLIYIEYFDRTFNGTRSIPDFDLNKGVFSILMTHHKGNFNQFPGPALIFDSGNTLADDADGSGAGSFTTCDPTSQPGLVWDNSTKILTLSPKIVSDPQLAGMGDYYIRAYHYK